eukprot:CAMPEP_0119376960 /NCGR_PEP_ID=MMETSP1334-20130426/42294_1 /TAXON_ID=127549 /ORGANISM="Calcidiscus leptoporus, Strain RCC1130" /LENGTH=159 /DNA_ID=CAMNT_0007395697 /DNA_START=207 /DNA_END=687 /DNA_ORIENTATION=+
MWELMTAFDSRPLRGAELEAPLPPTVFNALLSFRRLCRRLSGLLVVNRRYRALDHLVRNTGGLQERLSDLRGALLRHIDLLLLTGVKLEYEPRARELLAHSHHHLCCRVLVPDARGVMACERARAGMACAIPAREHLKLPQLGERERYGGEAALELIPT